MITLTETLEAEQKKMSVTPVVEVKLTHGVNEYIYDTDRILKLRRDEQPYSHTSELILQNSDNAISDIDLQGYKAQTYLGLVTGQGEEKVERSPQWVISQKLDSARGILICTLELAGIWNLMAEDRASTSYMPDETDTLTVKSLLSAVAGATLTPFTQCKAWQVVFDSEDDLIDSFMPKDSFRVYVKGSRLAAWRRLIDYTKCVSRVQNDGKIHVFVPTTTGESYDYEYSLTTGHTFLSKAYRRRVVIPGYVICKSRDDDDTQYSGYAQDPGYSSLPVELKIQQTELARLQSNEQATDIAEAILSKYQLHSSLGAADVPINLGAEIFDYVKVTDEREEDYRIGNLGTLRFTYEAEKQGLDGYGLRFSFGGWLSVRKAATDFDVYPDGIMQHFENLFVENLYAQYIYAQMIDVEVLSAITAKMGLLTAGEIRIGTGVLEPTGYATSGSQTTLVDTGASWTPDEWIGTDITVVIGGASYEREVTDNDETSITFESLPGGVSVEEGTPYYLGFLIVQSGDQYFIFDSGLGLLTATGGSNTTLQDTSQEWVVNDHKDRTVRIIKGGYWYERKIASNTTTTLTLTSGLPAFKPFTGIRIWADTGALEDPEDDIGRIAGYKNGIIQYYTDSDGVLYAGAGVIAVDVNGITVTPPGGGMVYINEIGVIIEGQCLVFRNVTDDAYILGVSGGHLVFSPKAGASIYLDIDANAEIRAMVDNQVRLGTSSVQWYGGYFKTELIIPGEA